MPGIRMAKIIIALIAVVVAVGYGLVGDGGPSAVGITPAPAPARAPGRAVTAGMTLGGVPRASAPTSAQIVIDAGAAFSGYTTKVVTISKGGALSVVNHDHLDHTVTSVALGASGLPLFNTLSTPGTTTTITGASALAAGTYDFYCRFHPDMQGKLIVEGAPGGTHPVAPSFDQPLVLPRVLTGAHIRIRVRRALVRVLPTGPETPMWTYGGSYPGPTIVRPAGHDTKVTFVNDLPASAGSITVHLHGDHHSSANDGQPDTYLIGHGRARTYDYQLTDGGRPEPAAFDYYHDHRMGETGRNNWNGLQGMFIITDAKQRALDLPSGRYDVPLLIADRSFTADNHLAEPFPTPAPPGDATVGDRILVDGRVSPYLDVTTHRYRLRLLNASNFSSYDFTLSNGQPFTQIGTGDDLLPHPVVRHDILLGPSQRADVVVSFAGDLGTNVILESITTPGTAPVGIGTRSAAVMEFRVTRAAADDTRVPADLVKIPVIHAAQKPSFTWTFGLGGDTRTGMTWTVNSKPFDPRRVDVEVPLGSTQTWLLKNVSPITHFVHLHEEEWHTLSIDGRSPPPWERGLEDTWRLDPGETIKVAARFTDYTGVFMVHCHMLDHEDDGMMATFAVVAPGSTTLPPSYYLASSPRANPAAAAVVMTMPGMTSTGMTKPATSLPSATVASVTKPAASKPAASTPAASTPAATTRSGRILVRSAEALAVELVAAAAVAAVLVGRPRRRRRRPERPRWGQIIR